MVSPTGLHGQHGGPGTFLPPPDETTSVAPPSLLPPRITSVRHTSASNDGDNPPLAVVGSVAEPFSGGLFSAISPGGDADDGRLPPGLGSVHRRGIGFRPIAPPPPRDAFHINRLEFEAVARALVQFLHFVRGRKVLVRSDSTTVVAYINHQGGTHSFNLWKQSWDLFLWASHHAITLEAVHLPGIHNTRADAPSRQWQQSFEWMLNPTIFSQVVDRCRIHPEVDLFASPTNTQTLMFCSQYPHQQVWHVNALSFPWRGRVFYTFPPPALVTRVLLKIETEGTLSILLIAPFWPARAWFPKLVRLLAGQPFRLPPLPDLLSLPDQDLLYPDPQALALVAWPLSGSPSSRRGFRRKLPLWRHRDVVLPPSTFIIDDCDSSENGAPVVRLVRLRPL